MRTTALEFASDILRDDHGRDFGRCESPSLRLEKFVRIAEHAKKETSKKDEIDAVVKCHSDHAAPIPTFEPKGAVPFVAKLRSRLIVNQAGGILENAGLCLHPHFGAPYIPGSAIKGIARHAAWCEWNEESDQAKKDAIAERIATVFGYPTGDKDGLDAALAARGWKNRTVSGSVAFLPAAPTDAGRLATDIVNCHHPKYYAGSKPDATDDESPNPQFFPTVDEGVSFLFSVVPVRPGAEVGAAKGWLVRALSENGAGAKTAAGYGWFDCDVSLTDKWRNARMAEQVNAERAVRKAAFSKALAEWKEKSDSELSRPAVDALAKELDAIGDESFRNANIGAINALRNRLPAENPLDAMRARWAAQPRNATIGNDIKGFRRLPDERKRDVVALLRETGGPGSDLWAFLKTDKKCQKGDIATAVGEIRAYCKNTMNLGKMP